MAKQKQSVAAKPKSTTKIHPDRPENWLYLHNRAALTFGVLRKRYNERDNSACEFGTSKLQPVSPSSAEQTITAARADVVLPRHAEDALTDPFAFLAGCDELTLDPAILVYLSIAFPEAVRLHHAWEQARRFARMLADDRNLASLVVLHAPGLVSSPNPPHVHLLICPRTGASPLGLKFGGLDRELICDKGADILDKCWRTMCAGEG
jgi:hypothetical protein